MLRKPENAFVNPLAQPDRRQRGFFRMPQQVLLFSSQEPGARFVELSCQQIRDAMFALHDRPRPIVELLPVEILIARFQQNLPRDAPRLFGGLFMPVPLKS